VVRIFGSNNGDATGGQPIQNPVGVFHEEALKDFDYVVATAGVIGIRLIVCLNNYWCVTPPCSDKHAENIC